MGEYRLTFVKVIQTFKLLLLVVIKYVQYVNCKWWLKDNYKNRLYETWWMAEIHQRRSNTSFRAHHKKQNQILV